VQKDKTRDTWESRNFSQLPHLSALRMRTTRRPHLMPSGQSPALAVSFYRIYPSFRTCHLVGVLIHPFKGNQGAHPLNKGITDWLKPLRSFHPLRKFCPERRVTDNPQSPLACASRMQVQERSGMQVPIGDISPASGIPKQQRAEINSRS
jgi:hypothetical protein